MVGPTVAAVMRRTNDRDELRAAIPSCRRINLISVAANGDSIRNGSVTADIVVLDPFASDAETLFRFLAEQCPSTKVLVLARSLRSIEALSIPSELVAIQAFDESFESVVIRFLEEGSNGSSRSASGGAASTTAASATASDQPETNGRLINGKSSSGVGLGRTRPGSLNSIPALALPPLTKPDASQTPASQPAERTSRARPSRTPSDRTGTYRSETQSRPNELTPRVVTPDKSPPTSNVKASTLPSSPNQVRSIVVLGASTGGPDAVRTVLGGLPVDFPLPILLVQHMPALFTKQFATALNDNVRLKVDEAVDGTVPRPGEVWVAPGGFHMEIADLSGRLAMSEGPKLHGCRPAVDVLFKSASRIYGPQVLAVVLTGMGHDGADGCQEIASIGGHVIVQDEATSTVWGMPGSVAKRGSAHQIVPLQQVAAGMAANVAASRGSARSRTDSRPGVLQTGVSQ